MNRPLFIVIITSLWLLQVPGTSVEADNWAVVPVASGKMSPFMKLAVAEIRQELERQGKHVRPSVPLTEDEIETWTKHSRGAIRELAEGNHATALHHLRQAEQVSQEALEELNREPLRAQGVLDTCLYTVRALLETNDAIGAKAHASQCVVLVPRGEPATLMHPPAVLALYERARDAGRRNAGNLLVESSPSGCNVRINGVAFGATPLDTNELSTGEYAVQVECDGTRRGRIHLVKIGSGTARVFIDARFERVPPARFVVLVSSPSTDMIKLDLVSRTGTRQGCARITATAQGPSRSALALAVRNLVNGKCQDL